MLKNEEKTSNDFIISKDVSEIRLTFAKAHGEDRTPKAALQKYI